jgi:hypothetical protein
VCVADLAMTYQRRYVAVRYRDVVDQEAAAAGGA